MPNIPFTQYLRPDGRQVAVEIDRPQPIFDKAQKIIEAGYRFECEHLSTGHVSFTITNHEGDQAIAVCPNGPQVPEKIDNMILNFSLDGGHNEES